MTNLTPNLSLRKGVDSDNAEVYLTVDLAASLDILDNAAMLTGVQTLTSKTLTSPVLNTPTFSAGAVPLAALGSDVGSFIAFTPTLTQGVSVTLSQALGLYTRLGNLIIFNITITTSSAGTGGSEVVLGGLPVAGLLRGIPGVGWYHPVGAGTLYRVVGLWNTSTSLFLVGSDANVTRFGSNPAITAANGDTFNFSGWYAV
jgi:hypothetical protein